MVTVCSLEVCSLTQNFEVRSRLILKNRQAASQGPMIQINFEMLHRGSDPVYWFSSFSVPLPSLHMTDGVCLSTVWCFARTDRSGFAASRFPSQKWLKLAWVFSKRCAVMTQFWKRRAGPYICCYGHCPNPGYMKRKIDANTNGLWYSSRRLLPVIDQGTIIWVQASSKTVWRSLSFFRRVWCSTFAGSSSMWLTWTRGFVNVVVATHH